MILKNLEAQWANSIGYINTLAIGISWTTFIYHNGHLQTSCQAFQLHHKPWAQMIFLLEEIRLSKGCVTLAFKNLRCSSSPWGAFSYFFWNTYISPWDAQFIKVELHFIKRREKFGTQERVLWLYFFFHMGMDRHFKNSWEELPLVVPAKLSKTWVVWVRW